MTLDWDGLPIFSNCTISGSGSLRGCTQDWTIVHSRLILNHGLVLTEPLSDLMLISSRADVISSYRVASTVLCIANRDDLVWRVTSICDTIIVLRARLSCLKNVVGIVCPQVRIGVGTACWGYNSLGRIKTGSWSHQGTYLHVGCRISWESQAVSYNLARMWVVLVERHCNLIMNFIF
jgi:hypothetical protein